ncbi:MAG TPA: ferredoxin-type protein NapF [Azospira sp.]|nr:ferredoxin-type protein NapF [Azospira sp.]
MDLSRRRLFRGTVPADAASLPRPPWALAGEDFAARCTACGDCAPVCDTGIIIAHPGSLPHVDFSQVGCTLCGHCVEACTPGALRHEVERPWPHVVNFGAACLARQNVECRICGETCDAGAIRFRPRLGGVALPQLDADACSGCGACISDCPTHAIALAPRVAA